MAKDVRGKDGGDITTLDSTEIDDQINLSIPFPIGGVMWWLKGETGVPALPSGFVECNGQTINDPTSPMDGYTVPDLNSAPASMPWLSAGLFIRGGTSPNLTPQQDEAQGHRHDVRYREFQSAIDAPGTTVVRTPDLGSVTDPEFVLDPRDDKSHGAPRVGAENMPAHVVMVAVVRIK